MAKEYQCNNQKENPNNDSRRGLWVEFFATELALVLDHAVDIGIHRGPITSLNLSDKTGEHFADVLLVL